MASIPTQLQAARLRAAVQCPYLATALWSLVPVESPGLGTLAVDRYWRLYYDLSALATWSVEEAAAVLIHEVAHLLRDHPGRLEPMGIDPQTRNLAADAEINDDLLAQGLRLPVREVAPGQILGPVTPQSLGLPPGRLAEEYAAALSQRGQQNQGQHQEPGPEPEGAGAGDGGTGATSQEQELDPEVGSESNESGEAPAGERGSARGSEPGEQLESGAGAGSGSMPDRAAANPSDSPGQPRAESMEPAASTSDGRRGGAESGKSAGSPVQAPGAGKPAPGCGRCGSCATGHPESWELPAPEAGGPSGVSAAEAAVIRRQVAEAIRIAASSDSQGWVPGGWRRWAESILEPRVDWRRELAAVIRAALANVAGAADYSYRRPSRRQAAVTGVILPAMRQPVPEVAVLLDTSGSMGDDRLARALAELGGVLRAAGQRDVCLIACDSAVHEAGKRVRRVEEVRRYLTGGGGTDLREGFQAAARLRPRPQVLVVLSDCETPWPDRPPSGMQVVVARIGRGRAPDWAKVVDVEEVQ